MRQKLEKVRQSVAGLYGATYFEKIIAARQLAYEIQVLFLEMIERIEKLETTIAEKATRNP